MSKGVFKILTIDGGGIKGLYSASILEKFEEKFNTLSTNHFDMICGTSTGGLIALAVALKIPAKEICNFYIQEGPKIFPRQRFGFLKQLAIGGKYSDKGLKQALKKIFGDKLIKDCDNLLCIPSYSLTESKPKVFKYDHREGDLTRDNNAPVVDIALATSAAPTYFPLAESDYYSKEQFIDGGVWANNPTLVGLLEALNNFVGGDEKDYDSIEILSLSSLNLIGGKSLGLKRQRSFKDWGAELFETSLSGQSYFTNFFMEKISAIPDLNIKYIRVPSILVSREQESLIQLDVANEDAFNLMKIKANEQALIFEKKDEIRKIFTTPKSYHIIK